MLPSYREDRKKIPTASKTICHNESLMTSLRTREENSEKNSSESSEDLIEEKQRSVNLEELKDWELKNIVKMSGPAGKVVPSSMANLPLRFGRNFLERRNIKPTANLPLRFGRAFRYFSHSFEKAPSVQSFFHSLANLPEKFGRSFLFSLIQGTQDCDQIKNRLGHLNKLLKRNSGNEEASHQNMQD
ncbi:pro-FMRFamide-related neuropeptide VF [Ahaetulla prasina]|uniref:pro-FMRFamide-related neuropeptide VF n=1 Tax=Ahaetulla prasina TaxID=499056 RepID=UPI002649C8AD|nr:pro-FMRFamide-related neuropeptide VF [Ahaetulla prasina]